MSGSDLSRMIETSTAILFDFDGPLCDVFAGLPAPGVARRLETVAGCHFSTDDPLEVLRESFLQDLDTRQAVEDCLVRAEIEAVQVSAPEVSGIAALRSFSAHGRRIAVVSNNSADAIEVFVTRHGLEAIASTVVGRAYRRPELMKPDPWSITSAVEELGSDRHRTVLVGDSMTDIEAAQRAGVHCIAYANKPSKVQPFLAMRVPVITSMTQLELPQR